MKCAGFFNLSKRDRGTGKLRKKHQHFVLITQKAGYSAHVVSSFPHRHPSNHRVVCGEQIQANWFSL